MLYNIVLSIGICKIYESKTCLMDDVQAVFSDCDPDEIYVMPEAANAAKNAMRVRKLKRRN